MFDQPVIIHGELFSAALESGLVVLVHPQWSLVGAGETVEEAREDLLHNARELATEMRDDDPSSLSEQAKLMRDFVLSITRT